MSRDEARDAQRTGRRSRRARRQACPSSGRTELRPSRARRQAGGAGRAYFIARGSWVDNVQLVRALVRAGERRGVRYLIGQPVEALIQTGEIA
jgi:glycine/D-amino acid oxidase-like deaminating enzyme